MQPRLTFIGIVLLSSALHLQALLRTQVPAQDGLKFIRAARAFQEQSWIAALRGTDQHPLYAMGIAAAQPVVGLFFGPSPTSWRIAAQLVAMAASLLLLWPLERLTTRLFGLRAGRFAMLLFVVLPIPAEIGHDTLADAPALLFFTIALWQGAVWLESKRAHPAICAGVAAGLGYWTRAEVAAIGVVLVLMGLVGTVPRLAARLGGMAFARPHPLAHSGMVLTLSFLTLVGSYALAKGQISEKLALRLGVGLPPAAAARAAASEPRTPLDGLPPKEESDTTRANPTLAWAVRETGSTLARCLGLVLVPLALVGAWKAPRRPARTLMLAYCAVFLALIVRHAANWGYLSHRHVLTLVIVAIPWAAWRYERLFERAAAWLGLQSRGRRLATAAFAALAVVPAVAAQAKPVHPSRWGYVAASQWLAANSDPTDAILDTRGWAGFLSGRAAYGPWHVRQALDDPRLRFVVLEERELSAGTPRAGQLSSWIASAGTRVAAFPAREGGRGDDILVYAYQSEPTTEAVR